MTLSRRIAEHHETVAAPARMHAAAAPYRTRFGSAFDTYTYFPRALLDELQQQGTGLPASVRLASATDPSVVTDIAEVTAIANRPVQTVTDRVAYRDALLRVYRKLPIDPVVAAAGEVLCIAPQREGRQLAEALGALPAHRSLSPSAKRISYERGIVVAMSRIVVPDWAHDCLLIDGVVASGATVMALLHALRGTVERVRLLTAQSTAAGVWAIDRYAAALGISCEIVVGHVSGVLNDGFYAVDPHDAGRVLLGDVGDTISDLPAQNGGRHA